MKKALGIVAALALLTSAASAQFGYGGQGKFSLSLFGGFGLSQAKGLSTYADNWDGQIFYDIYEYADIDYQTKNGAFFGGAFTFMFGPNFGLQLGGGMFGRNMNTDILTGWEAYAGGTQYYDEYAFAGGGKLSSIPLFLNFVGRFSAGMMDINVSAGPTLFLNKVEADATGIFGQNYWIRFVYWWGSITYEWLDFLPVAMQVPSTSWSGFGANFGLGIDFNISPMMAVFLDVRYFLCGSKEFAWEYIPGYYDGLGGNFTDWEFSQSEVDYLVENELTTPLKINPSFFAISGGFKVRFGGGGPF
jgi:hypothetical protein